MGKLETHPISQDAVGSTASCHSKNSTSSAEPACQVRYIELYIVSVCHDVPYESQTITGV